MKSIHLPERKLRGMRGRITVQTAACLTAFALVGCATQKDQYAASAEAQQRMAAEAAADTKAGNSVDTKETYLKLVEQMQREGLWFASLAHIDALEQRWGTSPESTRLRADALRQTGQAAQSEAIYKRLMGTPLEGAGYRGLGLLAGARGNYPEAIQLLKQAQRRAPTDALLLSDLGYAHLRAGSTEEARLPLMQALQLRPDSAQAQANLALYLELTNQQEQAAAMMEANRMSPTARSAIKEAAQQLRAGATAVPLRSTTSMPLPDETAAPLALKASRWSTPPGIRTAIQSNPAATASSTPLPSSPTP
ncbi:tetratricopeptide repeat protein [Variovorax sp. KBS0712]|uniref:tetratricopeptide repeat protein n=1 Tax=Variovorax sp. KBS0712 TaxID=2578111 RepID=UPI0021B0A405|nr:tetratricopeptide repeat protein [Variovorax sp. KBS0712]